MTVDEIKNKYEFILIFNILLNINKMIVDLNVTESFPTVKRFLRYYISLTCTNCIFERSFSRL